MTQEALKEGVVLHRVARAIAGEEYHLVPGRSDIMWPHFIPHARAAVEAMREPTETMMGPMMPDYDGTQDAARIALWQSMIDAALKEG